jgi:hypothetical protein
MKSKLPNFLIVGAAKCGTSSLHNYLNQHSDIFMPTYNKEGMKVKEPRFLIKDLVQNRLPKGVWNWDEYQALFDDVDSEKAIGESTVLYLYFYETAINNIKKHLGDDVKIIIMLRNPVDRAYSAYSFASRTTQENQSFELAIENAFERYSDDERLSPMILYKELGNYTDMVKAYKESFSNVHVVLYDDFISNTEKEVLNVFDFLSLEIEKVNTKEVVNAGGKKWNSSIVKNILMGNNIVKVLFKNVFPRSFRFLIKETIKKIFISKADVIDENTRKNLQLYYKDDIIELEKVINKDLSSWKK